MKKKKYIFTYNMTFMNILSFILLIIMLAITLILKKEFVVSTTNESYENMLIFIIIMIFYFILHEIIHGLFYFFNGAKWSNIKFGIALEKGILYCKSCEKITKRNILISVIAPFTLIGIVTYIIGLIFNNLSLIALSIINISGCAGDLVIFFFFLRRKKDTIFKEIGDTTTFLIETKEDLSDKKFLGIKYIKEIEDETSLEDNLNKKINISKISAISLIILLILFIIFILL